MGMLCEGGLHKDDLGLDRALFIRNCSINSIFLSLRDICWDGNKRKLRCPWLICAWLTFSHAASQMCMPYKVRSSAECFPILLLTKSMTRQKDPDCHIEAHANSAASIQRMLQEWHWRLLCFYCTCSLWLTKCILLLSLATAWSGLDCVWG